MSKDYIGYIFNLAGREIIGDFEGAYANCPNVWPNQSNTDRPKCRKVISMLREIGNGAAVLDIGCGYGDFVAELSGLGYDACGCDVSPTAIRKGQEKHPDGGMLEVADIIAGLPYADASFDMVILWGVFQYIPHAVREGLAEARRILKPGGILSASLHLPKDPIGKEHLPDYTAFAGMVREGFEVTEAAETGSQGPNAEASPEFVLFARRAES